ncbi:hypothetical protein F4802DRAFT_595155 [Xylaria palmicola]|nr:hypothetical protein F4802DRAFT_595155 [Xylaria palmicola]
MFLDDVDPADFDASFFHISSLKTIAMDPNHRQMLEVVYEGLQNTGPLLEQLNGKPFATGHPNNALGVSRAVMANGINYFLNIKGPVLPSTQLAPVA